MNRGGRLYGSDPSSELLFQIVLGLVWWVYISYEVHIDFLHGYTSSERNIGVLVTGLTVKDS